MDRFSDIWGKYDSSPVCHEGNHDTYSVSECSACDGLVFCPDHLTLCAGCQKAFCPRHAAALEQTNCGLLCEDCQVELDATLIRLGPSSALGSAPEAEKGVA